MKRDRWLILKIVKKVADCLPRKSLLDIEFRKKFTGRLDANIYSVEYQEHTKRKIYTNFQKRTIVTAVDQGNQKKSGWVLNTRVSFIQDDQF